MVKKKERWTTLPLDQESLSDFYLEEMDSTDSIDELDEVDEYLEELFGEQIDYDKQNWNGEA